MGVPVRQRFIQRRGFPWSGMNEAGLIGYAFHTLSMVSDQYT